MVSAPAGDRVATAGSTVAVVPERAFGDHLGLACGCAPLRRQVTGGRPGPPADAPRLRPARRGSAQIRETSLLLIPVLAPRARTRSSTLRVETPCR